MGVGGKVVSINISKEKGEKKVPVKEAFIGKYGLEGDGHSEKWHRQISLLSYESIQRINKKGIDAKPGDFAENLTIQGIELSKLKIGDIIVIGCKYDVANLSKVHEDNDNNKDNANKKMITQLKEDNSKFKEAGFGNFKNLEGYKDKVVLEVTQIGKECPKPCRIYYLVGSCIMPKEGIFCRVLKTGKIKIGDNIFSS